MSKYAHLFPDMSDQKKFDIKQEIKKRLKDTDLGYDDPLFGYERKCSNLGFDVFDVAMMGPWTLNEYFDMIGFGKEKDKFDKDNLLRVMEGLGAISLSITRDKDNKVTVEHSPKGKEELEACASEKLTRWDKFCAFFRIKTSHALQVETKAAQMEALNAKKQEVSKAAAVKEFSEKFQDLKFYYESSTGDLDSLKNAVKDKNDAWKKVFFGDAQVSDYTLSNGKKISPVSLCLAALQQKTNMDLSVVDPADVLARMGKAGNEKISEQIQKIGGDIKNIIAKKEAIINQDPKIKYLDDFLFEKPTDTQALAVDKALRAYIKPGNNAKKFNIGAAADYNNMFIEKNDKSKENLFGTAALMFKTKDDMQMLFGKNDPTYNMKNAEGGRLNVAADKMEQHVKKVYKALNLKEELRKGDNYEAVLKAAGFGDDYNKLDEAIKTVVDNLDEVNKEYAQGEVSNEAVQTYRNNVKVFLNGREGVEKINRDLMKNDKERQEKQEELEQNDLEQEDEWRY